MEGILSQNLFSVDRLPVPAAEARIESVGVNPLDRRRVDVAVDLTPCLQPLTVEMAIVGPDDEEVSCITVVENREAVLDKTMHLRRDAEPGEHALHVGIFCEGRLVHQAARRFAFRLPESGEG